MLRNNKIITKIKGVIDCIGSLLTPVDYPIKPITVRSNKYYARSEQLISLEDLCLAIKCDCAEILSNAIRAKEITMLYHHKMVETSNGMRMVIYIFPTYLENKREVILAKRRLYFDKQEVALYLKLLPVMPPISQATFKRVF